MFQFLEQTNVFNAFNFSVDVTNYPDNFTARNQNVNGLLCPSDPSSGYFQDPIQLVGQQTGFMGKSNYFGNLGVNGWTFDRTASYTKNTNQAGVFASGSSTRLEDITDGTCSTALYAEIKRGARPNNDSLNTTILLPNVWGSGNPATNPNNLTPPAACNSNLATTYNFTGLQYQRGFLLTALYTHTVPPNYPGRDCIINLTFDQAHLASRSYHPGGVNVAMADGSVRFIGDKIQFQVWQAIGTRAGAEIVNSSSY
jgi:prepilin-type processing-associated H-X9-DG protein